MNIRKATKHDKHDLAKLGYLVLFELYQTIAETESEKAEQIMSLTKLVEQEDVPMSYKNAHVYLKNGEVVGVVWSYPFTQFETMQKKLYEYGEKWEIPFPLIEEEARVEDYYIDTIAVSPSARRQGIGRDLLRYIISAAKLQGYQYISLIVEQKKENAQRLYEKHGFETIELKELYGETYQYRRLCQNIHNMK